jgi:hypothetical protein
MSPLSALVILAVFIAGAAVDGDASGAPIDWAALVRDPAADVRWMAAETLVFRGTAADGTATAAEIDAATGGRRPLAADDAGRMFDAQPAAAEKKAAAAERSRQPPPLPAAAAAFAGPPDWSPGFAHVVVWEIVPGKSRSVHIVESSPPDQVQPKLRRLDYQKPGDQIEQRSGDGLDTCPAANLPRHPTKTPGIRIIRHEYSVLMTVTRITNPGQRFILEFGFGFHVIVLPRILIDAKGNS